MDLPFLRLFTRRSAINVQKTKKDGFSGWVKCSRCTEMIHGSELKKNHNCCPKCDYHYRISAQQRIHLLSDKDSFKELFTNLKPIDPLGFVDSKPYEKRLEQAQEKTGRDEAIIVGTCQLKERPIALAVLDFNFMGGSMGSVVGERLTLLIELAVKEKLPLVIVSASGGARMQESIFSLMQMAKTSAALSRLHKVGIPYISLLTNPTTGGVTASFAALGDIIIAEPDALIGFTGPRIVEQVTKEKLPEGAQQSKFLLDKGMIDCIIRRHDMKSKISFFIDFLTGNERPTPKPRGGELENFPNRLQELFQFAKMEQSEELEEVKVP